MTFDPTTNRIEELYQAAKRDAEEAEAYAEELEEELREARMQSLSDLGQAQDAYKAQLVAETKLAKAVEVLIRADKNLTNLQPKIPQLVSKEWIPVIDGYVDPVIEACRTTLAELKCEDKS